MSVNLLAQLDDVDLLAVAAQGRDWPWGLLSQPAIPPGWLALVEAVGGGRALTPVGQTPAADVDDAIVLARSGPWQVALSVGDAPSSDGHGIDCEATVRLSVEPRAAELAALRRRLLRDGRLDRSRFAKIVADAGGLTTLRAWIRDHTADALVHGDERAALNDMLAAALQPLCFEAGLHFDGVTGTRCGSATLADTERVQREKQRRLRQIEARAEIEQAAAVAATRRLDDMSRLLAKLRDTAATDRDLRWKELLPALSPGERTQLLENLWRITPNRRVCRAIVAVSGQECVWLDPADPSAPQQRVAVPTALGPLRSLAYDETHGALLVGAALGRGRSTAATAPCATATR